MYCTCTLDRRQNGDVVRAVVEEVNCLYGEDRAQGENDEVARREAVSSDGSDGGDGGDGSEGGGGSEGSDGNSGICEYEVDERCLQDSLEGAFGDYFHFARIDGDEDGEEDGEEGGEDGVGSGERSVREGGGGEGVLVLPTRAKNWGPLYVARIKRRGGSRSRGVLSDEET